MNNRYNSLRGLVTAAIAVLALSVLSSCGGGAAALPDLSQNGLGGNGGSVSPLIDKQGVTSAFGIPAGLTGSVTAGQQVYNANCSGCHSSRPAMNFSQLQSAMQRPPMSSIHLSDQELADLTAWLNRNAVPPSSGGNGGTGTGGSGSGGTGTGTGGSGSAGDDDGSDDIGDDNGDDNGSDEIGDDNGSDDMGDDNGGGSSDDSISGDDSGDDSSSDTSDDSAGDDSSTGSGDDSGGDGSISGGDDSGGESSGDDGGSESEGGDD